ncbi:aspartate/glutamate racemase family protein [Oscillatoria sp. CS-180]|uniref:aspartate/glutamate racemase family protein n=1 Tax=Oscillatoria sp. CS-180 TaxID=3021720 RepID=UPI002330F908|nr:aspartate/glutamate racemase family protein [Oscillatoria sp. CS-180]MDB9528557.1 aspartate/glutamate racemase family protein [Oscillatoria sp. CS-180]
MRTIALLGGMSWESTVLYYQQINEGVKTRLGGLHSAKIVLHSVDFHEIEVLQHQGDWAAAGKALATAARSLQAAGGDFLVICTNTMHKVVPEIAAAIDMPILHIADATAAAIKAQGLQTVGLLGTQFTMEQAFYKDRLMEQHGLSVLVPEAGDRATIHRIIYDELCLGKISPASRQEYLTIINRLKAAGAEGIIAGCTEITLLIQQADLSIPLLDTTALHAAAAVDLALKE